MKQQLQQHIQDCKRNCCGIVKDKKITFKDNKSAQLTIENNTQKKFIKLKLMAV